MTGAVMELCKIIKWPNPGQIIELISKMHLIDQVEEAAALLTKNNPKEFKQVYDILYNETVKTETDEKNYYSKYQGT